MITHTIDKLHYTEHISYVKAAALCDVKIISFKVEDRKWLSLTVQGRVESIEKFIRCGNQIDSDLCTINTVVSRYS